MDSRTVQLLLATGNEQTVTDQTCSLAKVANEKKPFIVTVNSLLTPHPQINPPFSGEESKPTSLLGLPPTLPSLLLSSTNKIYYDRLYSSTTSVELHLGLIQDGLYTSWEFGFVFDPWLHDLQLLVPELFHLIPLSLLNNINSPVSIKLLLKCV